MIANFDGRGDILLFSLTPARMQMRLHMQYHASLWCRQEFNIRGGSRGRLLGTLEVANGVAEGQWSAVPQSQRWWLLCGYGKAAPPGCRVRAPGTTGALPSNVTNTMWHVGACSRTSPSLTHTAALFFFLPSVSYSGTQTPTHRNRHINTKNNSSFLYFSLTKTDTETQRHSNRETWLLTLAWTRTRTSLHSPCGCHQKQPLCPTLCKSNSLLLFSLVLVFSFPPPLSLLLSSVVPSSHSTSSHLSNTSPTTQQLSAFADPLR